jgi:peptidoglycan/xylan/chitin deacetylase (PgdA/CDA1 family)
MDRTPAGPIVVLPFAPDYDDLGMCDAPWLMPRDWLTYACDSFDRLLDESCSRPRMMSLGVHLRIIGRPGRIGAFEKFLQHARAARGVWWARSRDIAAHWARVAAVD